MNTSTLHKSSEKESSNFHPLLDNLEMELKLIRSDAGKGRAEP